MASLQSIGYRYLCKHNSGRNKDIIFPLLESQCSKAKLSEKPGHWAFPPGCGPSPVSCMSVHEPPGLLPGQLSMALAYLCRESEVPNTP